MEKLDDYTGLEIAIIGMSGRFPDSKNIQELWENLKHGKELIRFFSDEELRESGIPEELIKNPNYVKAKGFLEDIEYFDAPFFEYTNKEADYMDPQFRIFHECAYNALEDAGYNSEQYNGRIGLYAGAGFNPFWMANFLSSLKNFSDIMDVASMNGRDYLTTRVAYKLNLRGPSVTVQTACSTSLVAIHMACQALLGGECEMAMAGGVNILFPSINLPRKYGMLFQEGMVISHDGHCRPFDANASGFMGGDGVGVVVLKRLEDAIAEGDNIHAIIKGSAINNDGNIKVGYTAPSIEGQAKVIKSALMAAEVDPASISYIETHGTGTPLGDPIEIEGLKYAYKNAKSNYCGLGSVKSNMGHLDAAAGVAGLIKTVLALKNNQIPPSINYNTPNPNIDIVNSPFYINSTLKDWNVDEIRRAAVSSFGVGGTNAHIILEEATQDKTRNLEEKEFLILISARTKEALKNSCINLTNYLKENKELCLSDVAYTLQIGRKSFEHKKSLICSNTDELIDQLSSEDSLKKTYYSKNKESKTVVFLFSGLGSQYINMGLGLYTNNSIYRKYIDQCFIAVEEISNIDLKSILYPTESRSKENDIPSFEIINRFDIAQLSVFCFEYAFANLLIEYGITPDAIIGYSFGEYTAACVSGVMSLNDTLKTILKRGELILKCEKGSMLSVPLNKQDLLQYLNDELELAIDNGDSCIISGSAEAVDSFIKEMKTKRKICIKLQTDYAIHSSMMKPALPAFKKFLDTIELRSNKIPVVSNVTGRWVENHMQSKEYWIKHLSQTVEFSSGIDALLELPNSVLIEIGPGSDLCSMLSSRINESSEHYVINTARPEKSEIEDSKYLLSRIQKLWQIGVEIKWDNLYSDEERKRVSLPGYVFDKHRYWFKDNIETNNEKLLPEFEEIDDKLVKRSDISSWFYTPSWEQACYAYSEDEFKGIHDILVFCDNSELSKALVRLLNNSHQNVRVITIGQVFKNHDNVSFTLDPENENHYSLLSENLKKDEFIPNKILHLWGQNKTNIEGLTDKCIENSLITGFYSLTGVIKAIHNTYDRMPDLKLFVISNSLYSITGSETSHPLQANMIGACKVLPIEFRNVRCVNIDLENSYDVDYDRNLKCIVNDVIKDESDQIVAYRGGKRWVLKYKKNPIHNNKLRIYDTDDHAKTYLIVGGLCSRSNLGYVLAKYLSQKTNANIVLLSRTKYPSREDWPKVLKEQRTDLQAKIEQILEIEKLGGKVFTVNSDITSFEVLSRSVEFVENNIGVISGVINVAGIMTGKSMDLIINNIPKDELGAQFETKIKGTINLFQILKDKKLDFCIFTSSLTSVLGPFAAYSSANNFIDSFINEVKSVVHSPWTCINWDHLLGFEDKQEDQALALNHDDVIEVFERIISCKDISQVIVSTGDLNKRINKTFGHLEKIETKEFGIRNNLSNWFFEPRWVEVSDLIDITTSVSCDACIVFMTDSDANQVILNQLRDISNELIIVYAGQEYNRKNNEFTIDPENEQHYLNLFKDVKAYDIEFDKLFHLWNNKENVDVLDIGNVKQSQDLGFYSLLNITRAINTYLQTKISITVVTNNMNNVTGSEILCPEKATLLGPIKIIPVENPNISCLSIDIDVNEIKKYSPDEIQYLAKNIINRALQIESNSSILSLRNNKHYSQSYSQIQMNQNNIDHQHFKENGVYLFTGGLGGMSLEIARYISEQYRVKFVFIDNKKLPDRTSWKEVLESKEIDEEDKKIINQLLVLEENGSEYLIGNTDISNIEETRKILNSAISQFGEINGVFHVAGLIDYAGLIQIRSFEETAKVLNPKLYGAVVLNDLLKSEALDFIIHFSSIGNILSKIKFGQVAYNAGHEFLDVYSHYLRRSGIKAITVNWNDWENTGIAAKAEKSESYIINGKEVSFSDVLSIQPREGIFSLLRILEKDFSQIIVSAYDINRIYEFVNNININELSTNPATDFEESSKGNRPDLLTDYVAPRNKFEKNIIGLFQDVFKIERIGIDDDFFELGGDSIKAISLISNVQQKFGIDIPVSVFFNQRTVKNIAEHLNLSDSMEIEDKVEIIDEDLADDFFDSFPLSEMQKAYLMGRSEYFDMGGISANVYQESEIEIDLDLLNDMFNIILNRHPMLKIVMLPDGNQKFYEVDTYQILINDIRELSENEQHEIIKKERIRLNNHVFDEFQWPLYEILAFRITDEKSYIIFCFDHLIGDAASILIFVKDWGMLLSDPQIRLPEINYTYKDYVLDFNELKKSEKFEKSKKYWLERLDDFPFAPNIPLICNPNEISKPKFNRMRKYFPENDWNKFKQLTKKYNCTPSVVLCAAYARVLSYWSNQQELAINLTLYNRYPFHEDVNKIVGDFTMLVILGLSLESKNNFWDNVSTVQQTLLEALDNRFYDGVDFIRELRNTRKLGTSAVMPFVFTSALFDSDITAKKEDKALGIWGQKRDSGMSISQTAQVYIDCTVSELHGGLEIVWDYVEDLFDQTQLDHMFFQYISQIEKVLSNEDFIFDPPKADLNLLNELNKDCEVDYPKDKAAISVFEENARKYPDNIAVICNGISYTYSQLNSDVNRLARTLKTHGIKSGSVVLTFLDRSYEIVVSILAILKTGAIYLPVDITLPAERINFILKDSSARYLIKTSDEKLDVQPELSIVFVDKVDQNIDDSNISDTKEIKLSNAAYIIYTSGTTGNPKGVIITHKNLIRLFFNEKFQFDFNANDVWTVSHSFSFDFSVWEMYGALLNAAKLIIVSKLESQNPEVLLNLIKRQNVTVLNQTPSSFYNLVAKELYELSNTLNIRYVIFGGEKLNPEKLIAWINKYPETLLINMYGITETTVHVTFKQITTNEIKSNISNIGSPIPTLNCFVLDNDFNKLPVGVAGELFVGGEGVSDGYLNRNILTNERFIKSEIGKSSKLYKTGDIVKLLRSGEMEYIGRSDKQVKIRGHRIEIEEIEKCINEYKLIRNAIVVLKKDHYENNSLIVYYVAGKELNATDIRSFLSEKLPEYMIPAYFIMIDQIPLTINGKINYKKLPDVSGSINTNAEYEEASTNYEKQLVIIWKRILNVDELSINDDFFDLGGDSFKATFLLSDIQKILKIKMSLADVFNSPSIKGLAGILEKMASVNVEKVDKASKKEYYPLSSQQQRMYILHLLSPESTNYNINSVYYIEGEIQLDRFELSFKKLLENHEILRTSFHFNEDGYAQIVHESIEFKIDIIDSKGDNIDNIINDYIKPFDLNIPSQLRVALIKIEDDKHYLIIDMHHIITDLPSLKLIIDEFLLNYENNQAHEVEFNYKDYAEWQFRQGGKSRLKQQEKYWTDQFKDEIPALNLPTDFPRPVKKSFKGNRIRFDIDSETSELIREFISQHDVTMYMFFTSAFMVLLSKLSGQEDIIVGSPVIATSAPEFANTIGMFVNTSVLRAKPEPDKLFKTLMYEIKERSIANYENLEFQFEDLVEKLDLIRAMNRNPLFDVMIDHQHDNFVNLTLPNLKLVNYPLKRNNSKFDISLISFESKDQLYFNLEYSTELFNSETIDRFIVYFKQIVSQLARKPEIKISAIDILTKAEKHQLLYEFNNTEVDYPKDKTIHRLFEEQVEKVPNNIAVVHKGIEFTYQEINNKSNQLSGYLRDSGLVIGDRVSLLVERSVDMIIAIFGIVKAGGVYLPIDISYPESRIKFIIENSDSKLVLSQRSNIDLIDLLLPVHFLEEIELENRETSNLKIDVKPKDLSYIIYTSGSTGKPKGVQIEHLSVVNLLYFLQDNYPIKEDDTYLLKTSYCFDVSISELFGWFMGGGRLSILEEGQEKDPEKIIETIYESKVTHINFVPTVFNLFSRLLSDKEKSKLNSLKYIMIAGEALKREDLNEFKKLELDIQIDNLYGPTEATVYSSYSTIQLNETETIQIGKPISNNSIYILDGNLNIQPIGVSGELCIGGIGLARAYLKNPELTTEKFIDHPFKEGERLYRTGDLARWLPDGNIEFLGRIDHQVKIRGFRIELGEIESALLKHENIKESVVLAREENNDKYLCAYIVSKEELNHEELRAYMLAQLPDYMVPSYFVELDKLPLTSNGKINRRALPSPEVKAGDNYVAPSNEIEEKLVKIWSEILNFDKEDISTTANFFAIGGQSLKATVLVSKINKEFSIEISLGNIFELPTILKLATIIFNLDEQDNVIEEFEI
ncbi:MAG: amino acid adenylation domain-containing protein [Bacteroidales bacterium]|nr:amino acid adenylation domain-containing protein [Bacteroidales bacterium]